MILILSTLYSGTPNIQFFADVRTKKILVSGPQPQIAAVGNLIAGLDAGGLLGTLAQIRQSEPRTLFHFVYFQPRLLPATFFQESLQQMYGTSPNHNFYANVPNNQFVAIIPAAAKPSIEQLIAQWGEDNAALSEVILTPEAIEKLQKLLQPLIDSQHDVSARESD